MPCVILDDLEYSGGGKRSGDGQKSTSNPTNTAPTSVATASSTSKG